MKRRSVLVITLFVICGVVLGILLTGPDGSYEDIPVSIVHSNMNIYRSEQEMASDADLIIVGTVETTLDQDQPYIVTSDDTGALLTFYTISPVRVEQVLQGTYSKEYLNIAQATAINTNSNGEKIRLVMDGYQELKKDKMYILYLKQVASYSDYYGALHGEDTYSPLALYQGVVNLSDNVLPAELNTNYGQQIQKLKAGALERFGAEAEAVTGLDLVRDTE